MPGQPESIPWVFFDTQLYTSGTTTELTFFQTTSTDRTISNMPTAGALPVPQYFRWYGWGFDVLLNASTAAGGATGAIDDIARLLLTGRGVVTFKLSDKEYGPFPLSFLHQSGGPQGFGWGTFTAEESIQYAVSGILGGNAGWDWLGNILIEPQTNFSIDVRWSAAQTLAAGNTRLRMWMQGYLARKVV
jgi:hypothetical protein